MANIILVLILMPYYHLFVSIFVLGMGIWPILAIIMCIIIILYYIVIGITAIY